MKPDKEIREYAQLQRQKRDMVNAIISLSARIGELSESIDRTAARIAELEQSFRGEEQPLQEATT